MPSKHVIAIRSWDLIETPQGHVIITVPPGPRPRGILAGADGVVILTDAARLALASSRRMAPIVLGARTIIVAEADERIVRETLVGAVDTNPGRETRHGRQAA